MTFHDLPLHLWALIALATPALSQTSLSLDVPVSISNTTSSPVVFTLPTSSNLTVSLAFCSTPSSSLSIYLSNSTSTTPSPSSPDTTQLTLRRDGLAIWSGPVGPDAGTLAIYNLLPTDSLQLAASASSSGPFFDHLPSQPDAPLFGDSTSNQALLFSPVLHSLEPSDSTYPNYTFPPAQTPFLNASPLPPSTKNYTLVLAPTSQGLALGPQTSCAINAALRRMVPINGGANGTLASTREWLRDDGWRTEWLVNGLTPSTNYTVYAVSGTVVHGPVYFTTKSAAFACALVHAVPLCPSLSHAAPLSLPPSSSTSEAGTYTGENLPSDLTEGLESALRNFTVALGSFACGRDQYSPLKSCAECRRAYQRWICSVSVPRCAEYPPAPSTTTSSTSPTSNVSITATPTPALIPANSSSPSTRGVASLPPFNRNHTLLLPCYETCTAADRACPNFLGFKCPLPRFNAGESYGVGYVDSVDGGGGFGGGMTGVSQDLWGNVYCDAS